MLIKKEKETPVPKKEEHQNATMYWIFLIFFVVAEYGQVNNVFISM